MSCKKILQFYNSFCFLQVSALFYESVQRDRWETDASSRPTIDIFMLKIFMGLAPGIMLSLFLANNRVMHSWRQLGRRLYAIHGSNDCAHRYQDGKHHCEAVFYNKPCCHCHERYCSKTCIARDTKLSHCQGPHCNCIQKDKTKKVATNRGYREQGVCEGLEYQQVCYDEQCSSSCVGSRDFAFGHHNSIVDSSNSFSNLNFGFPAVPNRMYYSTDALLHLNPHHLPHVHSPVDSENQHPVMKLVNSALPIDEECTGYRAATFHDGYPPTMQEVPTPAALHGSHNSLSMEPQIFGSKMNNSNVRRKHSKKSRPYKSNQLTNSETRLW